MYIIPNSKHQTSHHYYYYIVDTKSSRGSSKCSKESKQYIHVAQLCWKVDTPRRKKEIAINNPVHSLRKIYLDSTLQRRNNDGDNESGCIKCRRS